MAALPLAQTRKRVATESGNATGLPGLGFGIAAHRPDVTDAAIVRPYGGQALTIAKSMASQEDAGKA